MALGSTQPPAEMSTRVTVEEYRWQVRRADNLNHLHVPILSKFGILILLEPSGTVIVLYKDCFTKLLVLRWAGIAQSV
jgi:hypothetical protein